MTVEQLLANLQAGLIPKPDVRLSTYNQIVPPLLDTLKSITGVVGYSYKTYQKWWDDHGKKFEVIDE